MVFNVAKATVLVVLIAGAAFALPAGEGRNRRIGHLATENDDGNAFDEAANAAGGATGGGTTCNGVSDPATCNDIAVFCKEVSEEQRQKCPVTCDTCNVEITTTIATTSNLEDDAGESDDVALPPPPSPPVAVATPPPPTPAPPTAAEKLADYFEEEVGIAGGSLNGSFFSSSRTGTLSPFETMFQELFGEDGDIGAGAVNPEYERYSGIYPSGVNEVARRTELVQKLDTNSDGLISLEELSVILETDTACAPGQPNQPNMVMALGLFFGFAGFFGLFSLLAYLGASDKLPGCMVAITPTSIAEKSIGTGQDGGAVTTFNLATMGLAQVVACVLALVPMTDLATRTRPDTSPEHTPTGLVAVAVLLSITQAASLIFMLKRKQWLVTGFLWLSSIFFVVLVSLYNETCDGSARGTQRAIWAGFVFQLFAALNAWWLSIRLHTIAGSTDWDDSSREIELQPAIVSVIQLYLTIYTCQMFCDNVDTWAGWSPAVGANGEYDVPDATAKELKDLDSTWTPDRTQTEIAFDILGQNYSSASNGSGPFVVETPGQVAIASAFMNLFVVLVPLCLAMKWLYPALICATFTEIIAFIMGFHSYDGMPFDLSEDSRYGWFGGIFGVQDWYMVMVGVFALFVLVDVVLKRNQEGWSCESFPPSWEPEWPLFFGAFSVMVNTLKLLIVVQLFIRALSLCRRLAPKEDGTGYEILDDATVVGDLFTGCGEGTTLLALAIIALVSELFYVLFTVNDSQMIAAGINGFEAIILIVAGALAASHSHYETDIELGRAVSGAGIQSLLYPNWRGLPGQDPADLAGKLAEAPANGYAALAWLALGLSLTSLTMFILTWRELLKGLTLADVAVSMKDPFLGSTDTDPVNDGAMLEGGFSSVGGCCDGMGGGGGGGGGKTAARGRRASTAPRGGGTAARGRRASAAPRAARGGGRTDRGKPKAKGKGRQPVMNPRSGRAKTLASFPEPEETNDDDLYDDENGPAADALPEEYNQAAADDLYGPEGDDADGDFSGGGTNDDDAQFGGFGDDAPPPLPGRPGASTTTTTTTYGSDNYHDNETDAPPPVPSRGN